MLGDLCSVTNQPSVNDWVVQVVPLCPSGLGVASGASDPGFDPSTVCYTGSSGNLGFLWVETPCLGWKWPVQRGSDFKKGEQCNEPPKCKRLGRSGIFMTQWFRRWTLERATRGLIPTRSVTVHLTCSRCAICLSPPIGDDITDRCHLIYFQVSFTTTLG